GSMTRLKSGLLAIQRWYSAGIVTRKNNQLRWNEPAIAANAITLVRSAFLCRKIKRMNSPVRSTSQCRSRSMSCTGKKSIATT
ncbi:MAG: hypothetical protein PHN55_15670, partial [Dysgonamonadaceae bacterium]|nr:hypothetical protein [Dysgonamonadaceae bacterium]